MNYFCTYFDRNYLAKALALFQSLLQHETKPYKVFVVCLDEVTRLALNALQLKNLEIIPLHEIEWHDQDLLQARGNRSLVEYYWTLTPTIMLRLMERMPQDVPLTYLDADLYFYQSTNEILSEFAGADALIHEHRFGSALKHLEPNNGRFNVGLVGIRNNNNGKAILQWWRDRCNEWCYLRYEDGKMGDQLYLDQWPTLFPNVHVLQHIGAGLAPWNHDTVSISAAADGTIYINQVPLQFYHFHAFHTIEQGAHVCSKHPHYPMPHQAVNLCYQKYAKEIDRSFETLNTLFPNCEYGTDPQFKAGPNHILIQNKPKRVPLLWEEGRRVVGNDDLLAELAGRPISNQIQNLIVIGAHKYEEIGLIDSLLPNLKFIGLFEPIPHLKDAMAERFAGDSRILVSQFAISDENGSAEFHVTNNFMSSSLLPLGKHKEIFPHVTEATKIPVQTRKLGNAMQEARMPQPDMLFIDVQGAEYKVLSGIDSEILSKVKLIYTEVSKEPLYEGSKLLDDVRKLLEPQFVYLGFCPLYNETPTHGNAIFIHRDHASALNFPTKEEDIAHLIQCAHRLEKHGKITEALQALLSACKLSPSDPNVFQHLANTFRNVGAESKAQELEQGIIRQLRNQRSSL